MKTDHELASRLMDSALSRGAHLAEVYQRASASLSTEVKNGKVEAASRSRTFGYGLRIIKDGRPGFSFSNDPADAEEVLRRALEVSAHASPDDSLGLPEELDSPQVDAFDMEVDTISEARARDLAVQVEEGARQSDPRIKKVRKASSSFSSSHVLIMNSRGLNKAFSATSCAASIMCVAEQRDDSQTGWGYKVGRYLNEVDFRGAGSDSARRATQMLGAKKVRSGRFQVLLDPSVSAEFLAVFSSMLSAESVQKGRSILKGRVGEKVVHEALTIIDNGLLPDGPGRRPVDDEGTPARENVLVRDGILMGYMHNTQSANRDGTASTGNAVRGGPSGIPSVGKLNMYFHTDGATSSRDDMISIMGEGLYVTDAMGVHTINPVSGDFSIGVSGLWCKGGKPVHAVKEAVIAGNLIDLFGLVVAIGDDLTFLGAVGSPSLLLGPVDLSA